MISLADGRSQRAGTMLLKIAQLGQPVLREPAHEVSAEEWSTAEFQQLVADMRETLDTAHGVGLAAPQVFASRRVFLAKIMPPEAEGEPAGVEVFVNPRVTA